MLRCSIVPLPQKSEPDLDEVRTRSELRVGQESASEDNDRAHEPDDEDRTLRPSAAVAAYTVKSDLPPRDDADPYDAITVVAASPSIPPIEALPEELYASVGVSPPSPPSTPARLPAEDEPDSVTLRPWQSVLPPKG